MENEQILLSLLERLGITKTETHSILIKANTQVGVTLGEGACKAVVLRLNNFNLNLTSVTTATHFYWGDNQQQDNEVLRGINSQIIFCTDQNQVKIRCQFDVDTFIQVMVYK